MAALTNVGLLFTIIVVATGKDCRWDKDTEYPAPYPPLVMDVQSWTSVLPVMEDGRRIVSVAEGTQLVLACPGNTIDRLQEEVVDASCAGGADVLIGGKTYALADLGCTKRPTDNIVKLQIPCGAGGEEASIGFEVPGHPFYEVINVCFDFKWETTLYSKNTIRGASIAAKDGNPDRPDFRSGSGFFTVSASVCYKQDSQIELMETLLQNASAIDVNNCLFLSRGHLAPDSDFATEQERDATYYYANALPQWQTFNDGNWREGEEDVRSLATDRGTDLQIWTGGWNVLELNDINKNPVKIFLGLTQDQSVIPAPDIMWKVVYDPATNEAAAIVGSNNPYLTSFPTSLCSGPDVCSQLKWFSVKEQDIVKGATYCCTVQDLRKAIPNVPDLGNATLLTG